MDAKAHWEKVYRDKGPDQVSWFQAEARLSRELIERAAPDRSASILDVGAGASTLVDGLLASGYRRLTVLDLSVAALEQTRRRLGADAVHVTLLEADVLTAPFAAAAFDVWHDRAVFHFLTDAAQRSRYIAQVRHAVRPGGHVLVATFADDGPLRCSGLEVARYSVEQLHGVFGAEFQLVTSTREDHVTPSGGHQAFVYCLCRTPA
ncbi:MAG: class I SAM-dependent methyltransferase [Gemmatimonadaceae bacterium]